MITFEQFPRFTADRHSDGSFQDLCDMMGGAEAVFTNWVDRRKMDQPLRDWVLLNPSGPLSAYLLSEILVALDSK